MTFERVDALPLDIVVQWQRYDAVEPIGIVNALDYAQAHITQNIRASVGMRGSLDDSLLFKPMQAPTAVEFIAKFRNAGWKV